MTTPWNATIAATDAAKFYASGQFIDYYNYFNSVYTAQTSPVGDAAFDAHKAKMDNINNVLFASVTSKKAAETAALATIATDTAALDTAKVAYFLPDGVTPDTSATQAEIDAYNLAVENLIASTEIASNATNDLNDAKNLLATEYLAVFWNPPPTNAEILTILNNLLSTGDSNISQITQDITAIAAASSTFTAFVQQMQVYNNYELLVEYQLQQLYAFLTNDQAIDNQEVLVTDLYSDAQDIISRYTTIVESNNDKAEAVKTSYDSIKSRMDSLMIIKNNISELKLNTDSLITTMRVPLTNPIFQYKKVVFLPMKMKTMNSANHVFEVDTSAAQLSKYGFSATADAAVFNMLYGFSVRQSGGKSRIEYSSTGTTPMSVMFKVEVFGTSVSDFDTTTDCQAKVWNPNAASPEFYHILNGIPIGTTNSKWQRFSSVDSTTSIILNNGAGGWDSVQLDLVIPVGKTSVDVKANCLVSMIIV